MDEFFPLRTRTGHRCRGLRTVIARIAAAAEIVDLDKETGKKKVRKVAQAIKDR